VTGRIALHGGGEFLPGDEPFLDALLEAARHAAADRAGGVAELIRIAVVPAAAARQRPDIAGSNGVAALRSRAAAAGLTVWADVALVVDDASAADPELAESITSANLVYLPGGDPDLIPGLLDTSTAAGRAMRDAYEGGSVLAGASAGAMALAGWTWTPNGGMHGLDYVPGVAVVPHFDDTRRLAWQSTLDRIAPGRLGYLGLDERTGVISAARDDDPEWVVAGEGAVHWYAPGTANAFEARHGERLSIGG
jgi:cyanophycinase-like exopeptidase